jgi:hypothetical protein
VVLDQTQPKQPVTGRFHDPFRPSRATKPVSATPPAGSGVAKTVTPAAASTPSGSAPTAAASAPTAAASAPTAAASSPTPAKPAAPARVSAPAATTAPRPVDTRPRAGYRLTGAFGPAGDPAKLDDPLRLQTLRANGAALLVYLGASRHGNAMFLVAQDAAANGDGTCLPTPQRCQIVELRHGDAEFFDVQTPGGLQQYELDIDGIAVRHAATPKAARKLRRRESKAGRRAMYAAIAAGSTYVRHFAYSSDLGAVVRVPQKALPTS